MGRAKSRRASAAAFLTVSLIGGATFLVTPAEAAGEPRCHSRVALPAWS